MSESRSRGDVRSRSRSRSTSRSMDRRRNSKKQNTVDAYGRSTKKDLSLDLNNRCIIIAITITAII